MDSDKISINIPVENLIYIKNEIEDKILYFEGKVKIRLISIQLNLLFSLNTSIYLILFFFKT